MDRVIEQLRENLLARRISIPLRNDAEDLGEHRCANPQIEAGIDEIHLQLRRVLHPYARRDLGETNTHDGTSNVLTDDLNRFLRCFRFGNEDQTATGLHCDGKRIVRANGLDELLDDRRLQRWIGTFLDQRSIQHASSMFQMLNEMTRGRWNRRAQASLLAR